MKFLRSTCTIISLCGLAVSDATVTTDADNAALAADGLVPDNLFPKQAQDIIRSMGSSDGLRGSGVETGQDFLDEDLEVSCVAKYCSKLYQLQKCMYGINDGCDEDSLDSQWVDVEENEYNGYIDYNGVKWERNDPTRADYEKLPFVTCKTSWGSAPDNYRWAEYSDDTPGNFKLVFRWKAISGSLKNKSANKCSNRCDYEGPKLNSLSLWGCCDSYSDGELEC